jgi:hypothetical protein
MAGALVAAFLLAGSPLMIRKRTPPRLEIIVTSPLELASGEHVFSFWKDFKVTVVTQNFYRTEIQFKNCGEGDIVFLHRWVYALEIRETNTGEWFTIDPPAISSFEPIRPGEFQSFKALIPAGAERFRVRCTYRRWEPMVTLLDRITYKLNPPVFLGDLENYVARSPEWEVNAETVEASR